MHLAVFRVFPHYWLVKLRTLAGYIRQDPQKAEKILISVLSAFLLRTQKGSDTSELATHPSLLLPPLKGDARRGWSCFC